MTIPISTFYEMRMSKVDLSELDNYLEDIISNIGKELESNLKVNYNIHLSQFGTRSNNWRFRKNHNFMEQYSNHDKILLDINCEINKITSANYKVIAEKVKNIIESNTISEGDNSIDTDAEYIEYILDSVFTNCIDQPIFCQFYLNFITELKSNVVWDNYIVDFLKLLDITSDKIIDNELISGKDKKIVKNIGLFYGQLYLKNFFTMSQKSLVIKINKYYTHLVNLLNQSPLDDTEFEIRLHLIIGFMENIQHKLWTISPTLDRNQLENNNISLVNHEHIPLRCKFAIQDLIDVIPKIKVITSQKKFDVRDSFKSKESTHRQSNVDDEGWERVVRKKQTNDKKNNTKSYRKQNI
jgi:hypothetical protein